MALFYGRVSTGRFHFDRLAYFLAIFLWLCLLGLFRGNATANELSKFGDAMVYAQPSGWVPDFFPGGPEPARRQWLFQELAGPLLRQHGFLAASVAGRLAVYLLLALGFSSVGQALGLRWMFVLPAVALIHGFPSFAAAEWIIGGVEPKVVSYGFALLALASVLRGESAPVKQAFWLGLATSFHVLIGLYAVLALAGVWVFARRRPEVDLRVAGLAAVVFLLSGACAWHPVAMQLLGRGMTAAAGSVAGEPSGSFIYVFLRAPHHLDPASWPAVWRMKFVLHAWVLTLAYFGVRWSCRRTAENRQDLAARRLLLFALAALMPFVFGLLVAPWDPQGKLLQYYPFRFGDVMLPLAAYFMAALALQTVPTGRRAAILKAAVRCFVVGGVVWLSWGFVRDAGQLRDFPGPAQGVSPAWKECTGWIRTHTPPHALFILAPKGMETFPWLAHRRALGTFKQVNMSGGLSEWYRRMSDLAGTDKPWPVGGWPASYWLNQRYSFLSTEQVQGLMDKYGASYVVRKAGDRLELPVVFSNEGYAVFGAAEEKKTE